MFFPFLAARKTNRRAPNGPVLRLGAVWFGWALGPPNPQNSAVDIFGRGLS